MAEYDAGMLLASLSYQHWMSQKLFSFGWWILVGVLAVTYSIWLKLLDKTRVIPILLLGSLCAVGFMVADIILVGFLGLWEYKITITPLHPPVFIVSVSIAPILYMLVLQYTASWRSYLLWAAIGTAVLTLGLLPLYSLLGIFQLYKGWNYFYHFLLMLTAGTVARAMLLWFASIERNQPASKHLHLAFHGLQPAASKPLQNDKDKDDK
jgi:hypothetical protein